MALNGKLVSGKEVVYRAIRDADLKGQDFNLGTMLEWLAEGLDLIGCPNAYVNKVWCVTVEDHRGALPCDLVEVTQAATLMPSGLQLPMREANGTFHPLFLPQGSEVGFINYSQPIDIDSDGNPVFNMYNYDETINRQLLANMPTGFTDITYTLNDNYIFTSFKDGAKVLIAGKAFPVDEDGFPLIPDNEKFKSYLTWHLLMKVFYQGWIKGKTADAVYRHAEKERDWYAGAATTAGLMPTIDKMEAWSQQYLHLIPRLREQNNFFKDLGNAEFLRLGQGWNRY